jgi:hypothetical protein
MSTHMQAHLEPFHGPLRILPRREPPEAEASNADRVHPRVYKAMVGLAVMWIVATLAFWVDASQTGDAFLFAVVLIVVAVAIPLALMRIGRHSQGAGFERAAGGSFRDWQRGELSVWGSRLRASEAAVQILLPLAAVAIGMLVFAIVAAIVLP